MNYWVNIRRFGSFNSLFNSLLINKFLLIFASLMLVISVEKANAQQITLSVKQVPLEKIFQLIEKQTKYNFVYNTLSLSKANLVDIKFKKANISDVLDYCLKNQSLGYVITGNNIIIKEIEKEQIYQQVTTIYGNVTDDKSIVVVGVKVSVVNSNIQTTTDNKGNYKIILSAVKNAVVTFESIGYYKQEIAVSNIFNIKVKLVPKLQVLEEIIIVGYGETNKRDLTGSIGTVNMRDISKAPVMSFGDAFAGRISGAQVTSPDGQPGAAPIIIIRGGNSVTQDNSPLYVIDGLPIESYNINAIHPEDIESIEVLKDASSTAIYGSRGSNGVVIITTKKGKSGKPVISINSYFGLQNNTSEILLMKPYEFVKYQLELNPLAASQQYLNDGKTLESYKDDEGINWQNQLFRLAPVNNFYMAIRGGNKTNNYAISGSLFDQKGTAIASGIKRYQSRLVFDKVINKQLKIGVNANLSALQSYGTVFTGTRKTYLNILINTWQYRPTGGSLLLEDLLNNAQDPLVASATNYQWNPVLTAKNELRNRFNNAVISSFYGVYDINKNFKFKTAFGLNLSKERNEEFNNSNTRLGSTLSPLGQRGVNGSVVFTETGNLINENTLVFNKVFDGKHFFNALSGFTLQQNQFSEYGSGAIRIPNESLGIKGISQGVPVVIQDLDSENRLVSFLGRLNYNYKSKYLFTGTLRADGSSKFTGNNKWGYFPSGSVAWNLAQENFLSNYDFLSESKIRVSYGLTGNNRVSDYAYYGSVTQGGNNSYMPGGVFVNGAYVSALSNPDLKWESTAGLDLGLDMGFYNQRYTITIDLYNKKTRNLLLDAQLPTSSGYSSAFQNTGAVENNGLELSLQSFNIRNNTLKWNTSFNISFNRTKLIGLAQNQSELLSTVRWNSGNDYAQNPAYIAKIGKPVAMFYGYVWDGVYQLGDFDQTSSGNNVLKPEIPNNGNTRLAIQPGDIKYRDINKDGVIDINDRTEIGNPNPKFYGGLVNNFNFKNFDFQVFLQFVYGNDIMNVNRYLMEGGTTTLGANQFASYQNRWTTDNPSNKYFRTRGWGPSVYSSRVIEDGSFLRLKTINFGYNVKDKLLQRLAITNCRFFLAAQNLITFTKYSGNDPEVSVFDSALTPGLDYSAYPRAKLITLGVDISF